MTLYTATEVAEKLKVKPVTILRLFDSGALPGVIVRQGLKKRIIRFSESSIKKFLTGREVKKNK